MSIGAARPYRIYSAARPYRIYSAARPLTVWPGTYTWVAYAWVAYMAKLLKWHPDPALYGRNQPGPEPHGISGHTDHSMLLGGPSHCARRARKHGFVWSGGRVGGWPEKWLFCHFTACNHVDRMAGSKRSQMAWKSTGVRQGAWPYSGVGQSCRALPYGLTSPGINHVYNCWI